MLLSLKWSRFMPTIKLVDEGTELQVVDKTQPLAKHPYFCAWCQKEALENEGKPFANFDVVPKIKHKERYVRVVYKIRGKFESDHICLDCWCGLPENGDDKEPSATSA
jgi:hypothetical protein